MSGAPGRPRVWRAPLALGALSAAGLVLGLLGEGLEDGVAWLALGTPVAVALGFALRPGWARGGVPLSGPRRRGSGGRATRRSQ